MYNQVGMPKAKARSPSLGEFNGHVDADIQIEGCINIGIGIYQAKPLLNASPSSAAFIIIFADGNYTSGDYPGDHADFAEEGTIVFAMGVGESRGGLKKRGAPLFCPMFSRWNWNDLSAYGRRVAILSTHFTL